MAVTAVFLAADAPLHALAHLIKKYDYEGVQERYIDCESVLPHDTGFLRLTPVKGAWTVVPAVFIPAHYVTFMLQAETEKPIGFLPHVV